jgi:hypothetical protein
MLFLKAVAVEKQVSIHGTMYKPNFTKYCAIEAARVRILKMIGRRLQARLVHAKCLGGD